MKIDADGPVKDDVGPWKACDAERCRALRKLSSAGRSSCPTVDQTSTSDSLTRTSQHHDQASRDLLSHTTNARCPQEHGEYMRSGA
jgi:hypothetical protein